MKALAVIGLTISTFLSEQCSEPRKPLPQLDDRHVITVDGSTVRYNGKLLPWDVPAERWQDVLGPYSRRDEEGHILTWDELGLFLYEERPSPIAGSLEIQFGWKPHSPHHFGRPDHWPKKLFPGRLIVDGALIHKNSTILEINTDKKAKPDFRRGYMDTIYSYDRDDGFYVRLDFGHDGTLTAFSISKPRRAQPPKATKDQSTPKRSEGHEDARGHRPGTLHVPKRAVL
jgi:hypothetical protein